MILDRYIQINEDGYIMASTKEEVKGVSIDIYGMNIPEQPTDGKYRLHYDTENGLEWVEYEPEPAEPETPITDPVMEKLDSIEAKIQTNTEMEEFYTAVCQEVGLV